MQIHTVIDLAFFFSYLLTMLGLVFFVMSEEIRKSLGRLIRRSSSDAMGSNRVLRNSYEPEIIEERREVALDYLVKNYFEKKKLKEEYLRKRIPNSSGFHRVFSSVIMAEGAQRENIRRNQVSDRAVKRRSAPALRRKQDRNLRFVCKGRTTRRQRSGYAG